MFQPLSSEAISHITSSTWCVHSEIANQQIHTYKILTPDLQESKVWGASTLVFQGVVHLLAVCSSLSSKSTCKPAASMCTECEIDKIYNNGLQACPKKHAGRGQEANKQWPQVQSRTQSVKSVEYGDIGTRHLKSLTLAQSTTHSRCSLTLKSTRKSGHCHSHTRVSYRIFFAEGGNVAVCKRLMHVPLHLLAFYRNGVIKVHGMVSTSSSSHMAQERMIYVAAIKQLLSSFHALIVV